MTTQSEGGLDVHVDVGHDRPVASFRFRRTVKIAPGLRLNLNKRSIGLSAGAPGARVSINSDGRSTRSVGIPGTGLYYRAQTGPRAKGAGRSVMATPDDPLGQTSDEELLLSIVMAHFNDSPSRTVSEILATDEKHRRANQLDPNDPAARETAARLGITPEKYCELEQQMDAEERERMAVQVPAALDELVRRRFVTYVGDTYTVTSEGRAYLEHKQAQGGAARVAQGSTPEARRYVLSLLGPHGGSLYDVIGRSKEHVGFGLQKDWAELNLDELLARGEVTKVGDRYMPTLP